MIPAMKRLFVLLAACALLLAGCKDGNKGAEAPNAGQEPATKAEAAQNDFTFDELFRIFSCFGENVMSDKFAAQSVKDGIKGDLSDMYEGAVEFTGDCNVLSYSFYNDGCSDDFLMACYRCKADDHVLAMLMETGGCDVTSVKYLRAYEYDPGQGSAHEIALPFEPKPERDDFEDMIRLAGADVPALRDAMRRGSYRYEFRTDGVTVRRTSTSRPTTATWWWTICGTAASLSATRTTAMPASMRTVSPISCWVSRRQISISIMIPRVTVSIIRRVATCG